MIRGERRPVLLEGLFAHVLAQAQPGAVNRVIETQYMLLCLPGLTRAATASAVPLESQWRELFWLHCYLDFY